MSQKSKTLLQLLQQQHHFHEDANTSLESNYRHSSEHTEKKFDYKLQKSINDLYSQIKQNVLKTEDSLLLCQIRKLVPIDKPDELHSDPYNLICYIGCIFTVLLQEKVYETSQQINVEQQIEEQQNKEQSDYEEQLIKLEADIRQHIRIEQQLKLFAENTQSKLEDALKSKEDLEEELTGVKSDFQILYEKNNTLNMKIKQQEQELKYLKQQENTIQNLKYQQNSKGQLKKENLENEFPKQPVTINLQIERQQIKSSLDYDRLQTDPQEDYFNKNDKRIQSTHINSNVMNINCKQKPTYIGSRIQTEQCEIIDKRKRGNFSTHENSSNVGKHQRTKTTQNVLNLIKEQELKRQQSVKGCQDKIINPSSKIKKQNSSSQHTDANRSNNSVHSFRRQQTIEINQIPRPFSCAEQIEEVHPADVSIDVGNCQKQNTDYGDNQQQIKKLLQQYQQKHSLNDSLTKKLLQEYKKRQTYNCKTIY